LLGSGSLHASLIRGGQELSSYPESCTLQVERRTIPGETPPQVEAEIEAVLESIRRSDPTFLAAVKRTFARDPFEIAEDSAIVQTLSNQSEALLGSAPDVGGGSGWMDSALLSAAGIPTVIFGPGGDGAHAVVEWVDLEQVRQCSEVLLATIQDFCA
jgi:acetylornithine deacetylase